MCFSSYKHTNIINNNVIILNGVSITIILTTLMARSDPSLGRRVSNSMAMSLLQQLVIVNVIIILIFTDLLSIIIVISDIITISVITTRWLGRW